MDLAGAGEARGIVVVVDVLRAFTTAAYAFAAGAAEILPVGTVREALGLRDAGRADLVMGEVGGLPVAGFDLPNSPAVLEGRDLGGTRIAFRTTNGTQGIVRAVAADTVLVAGFVVADATARAVLAGAADRVTVVVTGGEEDRAFAELLGARLRGEDPDPAPYLTRARASAHAAPFIDPARPEFPAQDVPLCLAVDRFDLAMPVEHEEGHRVIRPADPGT